jgi:hypothetical protein
VKTSATAFAACLLVVTMVAFQPQPNPGDLTQERYSEVTAWCDDRFPYRDDLQAACKWGAYEMTGTSNK